MAQTAVKRPVAASLLPHLRRAHDHIDRHYAEPLDLDQLASVAGLGLRVDDCRKTYEELSAKGVTFLQEPSERPTVSRRSCATTPATGSCWSSPGRSRPRTLPE